MSTVRSGVDRVADGEAELARHTRTALLTNRAARTSEGRWTGKAVQDAGCAISLFLAPEHGLDATAGAGDRIPHSSLGDTPVVSMYGADWGPVEEALSRVDHLIVDLPDVGCRYYTYPWTMREALKLAARHRVSATVLDRPNPIGGAAVEGNLPDRIDSPVCPTWATVRHGLTLGELALWQRRTLGLDVEIRVIPAAGWKRPMLFPQTGMPWVPPSPALRSFEALLAYPGTCLLEGTNISEGRGTDAPFLTLGAPFVDGPRLAGTLSSHPFFAGASLRATSFVPATGKWASERCEGVHMEIAHAERFEPVRAGLALISTLARLPQFTFRPAHFDALAGTSRWRERIEAGESAEAIAADWSEGEGGFRGDRVEVLLPDYGSSVDAV